jgi:uncharacterized protein YjbI with pentapeptide repeats
MDPTVVAAWIAAGVSMLTLVGTLAAQYVGRRASSRDAERTIEEQRGQLERTFAEQRDQLDRTLGEQRARTFNERFATAAEQLGSDKAAVRLAGVYAMARLADDWKENRQTCVDVLCAYLRMPYEPDPGQDAPSPEQLAFQANREVRHTVIRVITAHLKEDAKVSWQGLNLDFRGVVFDGGDFSGAQLTGGQVDFSYARFSGGTVSFQGAQFSGGRVSFWCARFSGGTVSFQGAQFSGAFVDFYMAGFTGSTIDFSNTEFSGGRIRFDEAGFTGGRIDFIFARFTGCTATFLAARFYGGAVSFLGSRFSGGSVDFSCAEFSRGTVDFSEVKDWSHPPTFPGTSTPPPGVKLPGKKDQPEA